MPYEVPRDQNEPFGQGEPREIPVGESIVRVLVSLALDGQALSTVRQAGRPTTAAS